MHSLQDLFSFLISFTFNIIIANLKRLQQEEMKSHTQTPHPATYWVFTEDIQTPSERRTHKLSIQDCDTFETWNWTDLDKKPKLLYIVCDSKVAVPRTAYCTKCGLQRSTQTVLRADVSRGQCPACHPFVSDSIPSQAQHWRIRHSWASAFQEQRLVATALWARASAATNSWKCCSPSPQPPPDTKAFSNSTQEWVHSVLSCRGSQSFWHYQHSTGLKHAMNLGGLQSAASNARIKIYVWVILIIWFNNWLYLSCEQMNGSKACSFKDKTLMISPAIENAR